MSKPFIPSVALGHAVMRHHRSVDPMARKRLLDVFVAGAALVVLSPVMVVVAVLVRVRHGSPILFCQERLGLDGRRFELIKFRTMSDARGPGGELLPDAERLTSLGRFLRSASLDELPELVNVVRGTMSLVGPRPLPVKYRDRYTSAQFRRHAVPPGITGWAQVNGRNDADWETRFVSDLWYVDNRSLWLDVRILFRTVLVVLRREGISAQGEATMSELPPRQGPSDAHAHRAGEP